MNKTWTKEEFCRAVKNSISKRQVLIRIGLKPVGGNYSTFDKYVKEYGLDVSHMMGKGASRGIPNKPRKKIESYLVKNSSTRSSYLRKRLIREGIKEPKCEWCSLDRWMGDDIPLELDHINGNRNDDRLENLRILCPNCHAMTPTYRGRNTKPSTQTGLAARLKNECLEGSTPSWATPDNQCQDCYGWISVGAERCKSCAARESNENSIDWPERSKAIKMYIELDGNLVKLANKLGVSDNAIRKRYNT